MHLTHEFGLKFVEDLIPFVLAGVNLNCNEKIIITICNEILVLQNM